MLHRGAGGVAPCELYLLVGISSYTLLTTQAKYAIMYAIGEYVMAHFEKYKIAQVNGLLKHYNRENKNYSNDCIDHSKTALNYNLCSEPLKSSSELKKALIEEVESLKGHLKSNAVAMVDLCITLPKEEDDEKTFFKACFDYLEKKFPCVVNASVHLDETTPHLHYAFIPITEDGRLCAKEIINRNMLRSFHQNMEKDISKTLGHEVHLLNGATSNRHKEVLELKIETLKKNISELNNDIDEKKNEMKKLDNEYQTLKSEYNNLNNRLDIILEKKENKKDDLSIKEIKEKTIIAANDFEAIIKRILEEAEKTPPIKSESIEFKYLKLDIEQNKKFDSICNIISKLDDYNEIIKAFDLIKDKPITKLFAKDIERAKSNSNIYDALKKLKNIASNMELKAIISNFNQENKYNSRDNDYER